MAEQHHGLAIRVGDRTIRLKWHRLRRSLADPLFSSPILRRGAELGASMELDFRIRRDHGFVALHDETLARETTGSGLVSLATADDLRHIRVLPGNHPPMLSEDIAEMLAGAHPQALLQLDMKDNLDAIGPRGIDHLRYHFADATASLIISARDLDLIVAVKKSLPDLRRGIDPTSPLLRILKDEGAAAAEAMLRQDILGPTEPDTIYLSWELLLAAADQGLDLIGVAHDLGRAVDAWTFNLADPQNGFDAAEAKDFSRLVSLQPDQITTDEPDATERAWTKLCGGAETQSKIGSGMT